MVFKDPLQVTPWLQASFGKWKFTTVYHGTGRSPGPQTEEANQEVWEGVCGSRKTTVPDLSGRPSGNPAPHLKPHRHGTGGTLPGVTGDFGRGHSELRQGRLLSTRSQRHRDCIPCLVLFCVVWYTGLTRGFLKLRD